MSANLSDKALTQLISLKSNNFTCLHADIPQRRSQTMDFATNFNILLAP